MHEKKLKYKIISIFLVMTSTFHIYDVIIWKCCLQKKAFYFRMLATQPNKDLKVIERILQIVLKKLIMKFIRS